MQKQTLEALGLRTRTDIPAAEIFASTFDAKTYGLSSDEVRFIHCLRDFVMEYNREIPMQNDRPVTCSQDAADIMYDLMRGLDHEEVWTVTLNSANVPLGRHLICTGGLDASVIDSRRVVKTALEENAKGVILFHNHPSGKPEPSVADIRETEKLRNALGVFDMNLIDHVVLSDSRYYSFSEEKTHTMDRNRTAVPSLTC